MTQSAHINLPGIIHIGAGAIDRICDEARRLNLKRILIVTDEFMALSEDLNRISESLHDAGIQTFKYSNVTPDPTDLNVVEGLKLLKLHDCNAVLSFGGGSSIDAAKGISMMATNTGRLSDYMGYHKIPASGLPHFSVPTTAGTGSEMTRVSVITDTSRNIKMMILDAHLVPTAAFVDYTLTMSMPKALTAHVGVDTLTHGIEAYISRKANPTTDIFAMSCIRKTGTHLERAWSHPHDETARAGMMLAASYGGMAFANSSVCLVHGMSRPLGAVFHLAHGLSNAVLLPAVTKFSISSAPERYAEIAVELSWAQENDTADVACEKLIDGLENLNRAVEIPRLRDLDISESALAGAVDKMADDALASGSPQNNPRIPDRDEIKALYMASY